jgi:hypothetical protein
MLVFAMKLKAKCRFFVVTMFNILQKEKKNLCFKYVTTICWYPTYGTSMTSTSTSSHMNYVTIINSKKLGEGRWCMASSGIHSLKSVHMNIFCLQPKVHIRYELSSLITNGKESNFFCQFITKYANFSVQHSLFNLIITHSNEIF